MEHKGFEPPTLSETCTKHEECPICFDDISDTVVSVALSCKCTLQYHPACIFKWFQTGNVICPHCRNPINTDTQTFVKNIVETSNPPPSVITSTTSIYLYNMNDVQRPPITSQTSSATHTTSVVFHPRQTNQPTCNKPCERVAWFFGSIVVTVGILMIGCWELGMF
jgi:hypothetical protein